MIRIIIAEDQAIVRQGLAALLSRMEGIRVVGEAANGREAVEACRLHRPDLVLMDVQMPVLNGVEATLQIKKEFPAIQVLILTTFDEDEYLFDALQNGASGYLLKDATPEKIGEAIREVMKGGAFIAPPVAKKVVARLKGGMKSSREKWKQLSSLTDRELEIIRLIGEGKSNKEIAETLFLTQGTVKNYISGILQKLELRDRTQIAIFALRNDLV
ncbi:Uncharacterized transcriptional regulatory protein YfiK [[Clostridium] ultunense Esp]|nr:Uncharacterized transcriptional regulatory protein YfiK [[Clostridium] ultunense Esp]